uniref:Uncharacterized protein n=1 Tax=Picea sitchensis TaxID=3332 RepID=A9P1Z6_PICSI|nr:unknown [Picea sitchensis]
MMETWTSVRTSSSWQVAQVMMSMLMMSGQIRAQEIQVQVLLGKVLQACLVTRKNRS